MGKWADTFYLFLLSTQYTPSPVRNLGKRREQSDPISSIWKFSSGGGPRANKKIKRWFSKKLKGVVKGFQRLIIVTKMLAHS